MRALYFLGALGLCLASQASAESVRITYVAPNAHSVQISGNFPASWGQQLSLSRDLNGEWSIDLDLPPGRYEYQFLIDKLWAYKESVPNIPDGFGGRNNILIVPDTHK